MKLRTLPYASIIAQNVTFIHMEYRDREGTDTEEKLGAISFPCRAPGSVACACPWEADVVVSLRELLREGFPVAIAPTALHNEVVMEKAKFPLGQIVATP